MGSTAGDFTHVFAVRIDRNYQPVVAYEIPRTAIEKHCPKGRMELTKGLESDSAAGVVEIAGEKLLSALQTH